MNCGTRRGPSAHPLGLQRGNWEFFAVLRGEIRPVFPDRPCVASQERRLWVLPPESRHTWVTRPNENCEMVVFHFASIHPLLESSLSSSRRLSIPLAAADIEMLTTLHRELLPHYRTPELSSRVHFEAAMLRLCSLFLRHRRDAADFMAFDWTAETVLRAAQWHREHLPEGIGVNDVAAALHISPSQLRRVFLRVRGESPKRAFMRTTIEEACRLMAQTTLSLKEVAAHCGFRGFSEFYRSFKKSTGQSPSYWRSNRLYGGLGFAPGARMSPGGRDPANGSSVRLLAHVAARHDRRSTEFAADTMVSPAR